MTTPIKLRFMSKDESINALISLEDQVESVLPLLEPYKHENESFVFIFEGRRLDPFEPFSVYNIEPNDVIQIIINRLEQAPEAENFEVTFRGGYEAMLETGVERSEVIRARLSFLARTGYLTESQLQILYLNGQILPPPRGYTTPRLQQVRAIFAQILQQSCGGTEPYNVEELYKNQIKPQPGENYPEEYLSQSSFVLMMLEGGFNEQQLREFAGLIDLRFIGPETPCPTVPVRAMKLEIEWQSDTQNHQNLQELAEDEELQGPGNLIEQENRVMSSFQRLLTMVAGILLGLVFNVIVLVFSLQDSMPVELRLGIMIGCCANVVFALFIGLAGL